MDAIQNEFLQGIGKWTINFGKYKGITYGEIKEKDVAYLKYLVEKGAFEDEKYQPTNDKIKAFINL
jgi:hypothetical protein